MLGEIETEGVDGRDVGKGFRDDHLSVVDFAGVGGHLVAVLAEGGDDDGKIGGENSRRRFWMNPVRCFS